MRTVPGSTLGPNSRAILSLFLSLFVTLCLCFTLIGEADAKKRKRAKSNPKYAAYVIDAKSGKVLHSRHGDAKRYPASLTKMMTLYLVFEDLKKGKIKKSSRIRMSKNAARRPPSKLGVPAGRSISVEQAILSLVTKSANDVATAVGENISGSEPAFARRMTRTARRLGMKSTTFKNANGLTAKGQLTTASDMAKLGLALREHFPRQYRYFKTRSFKYGKRRMGNHNRLLGRVRGVDGIKTGYTRASGYNLVTSVSHGGRKIVAVVMGGRSGGSRNAAMTKLIKRYLPKATRGKGRNLIAMKAPVRANVVAKLKLPKKAPKPSFSPNAKESIQQRIAAAHDASKASPAAIETVRKKLVAMATIDAPKPIKRPDASKLDKSKVDMTHTASIEKPQPKGWQVQISASETKAKAIDLLKKARAKNRRLLRRTANYTQKISINGTDLYRARFVGFTSKTSAKKACKALKRKRFKCIALKV